MKKYIFVLALSLFSCRCSPVQQTQIDSDKRISDLSASNWILRAQNSHKDSLIIAYKDTADMLRECQEGNRQLHQYFEKK